MKIHWLCRFTVPGKIIVILSPSLVHEIPSADLLLRRPITIIHVGGEPLLVVRTPVAPGLLIATPLFLVCATVCWVVALIVNLVMRITLRCIRNRKLLLSHATDLNDEIYQTKDEISLRRERGAVLDGC